MQMIFVLFILCIAVCVAAVLTSPANRDDDDK